MKNLILRAAVILSAATTLFYIGCGNNGADSETKSGGRVDDLIDRLRGTNDPKVPDLYTLNVTTDPDDGGSVYKSPDKPQYADGESVLLTATPTSGYRFVGWSGSQTSPNTEMTVTMDSDKDVIANFLPEYVVTRTLTVTAIPVDGGTVSKSPDLSGYRSGETVMLTAAPAPGYRFTGWSGSQSSTNAEMFVLMDDDKYLVANFAPQTYTLTINADPALGSVSSSPGKSAYSYNEEVTVIAAANPGYEFTGWSGAATSTDYTITIKMDGNKILNADFKKLDGSPVVPPVTSYTLTTNQTPENGGTVSRIPNKTSYNANEQVYVTAEAAAGYRFVQWSGAIALADPSATIIMDNNKELTAIFAVITYTLTVNINPTTGGEVSRYPNQQSYNHGTTVTVTATANTGYTFTGWTGASDGTGASTAILMDGNRSVTANFEQDTYTITFNANGGSVSSASGTTGAGRRLTSLPTPTRDCHTFNGWFTTETGGTQVTTSTVFSGNADIIARWTRNTYTVTFNANNGSVTPTSGTTNSSGTLASLPAPTRTGYNFAGWYTAATGGSPVDASTEFCSNTTIYAQWTLNTYTITFNANDGYVTPTYGTTGTGGTLASLPTPTRTGYTFNGWFTAATGGTAVTESRVYSANTTIYAQWTLITYTITFNANSGTVDPTSGTTGTGGTIASLPTPTRTGYTFTGWFTAATGGTQITTSTVFSANTTIYAQWTLKTYTVTFNANNGSVDPASGTTGTGGTLASLPTPTRTGYTFNGWFTASTGGTAVTTSTVFSANTNIYAQWTLITYTITFNANSGTVDPTSRTTGTGGTLTFLPTPTRTGYTFAGWYTETTDGTRVTTSTVFSANTTIYAQWTVITYTITFNANSGSVTPTSGTTGAGWTLVSLPTPTRGNYYTFNGWFTAATGGTQVTTSTIFSANTTIYAQWTRSGETFVDSRDGKTYGKVTIGSQTWMAENLNYNASGSVCYNNSDDNCANYGRLYNWSTAMNGASSSSLSPSGVQGVCPAGWHLPSDAEWGALMRFVNPNCSVTGSCAGAGTKLKSSTGWNSYSGVPAGTDEHGFSALPGGIGNSGGNFLDAGYFGNWWSATEFNASYAWYRYMLYNYEGVNRLYNDKTGLFSVRCLQD